MAFIDICLQDQKLTCRPRCPGGTCVTTKIDEYAKRLRAGNYDQWGASGDLAFLIHLVGDIHQPLHAATDADRGGNCITVESRPYARNLHVAWDTAVVYALEVSEDSGNPDATATSSNGFTPARKTLTPGNQPVARLISPGNRIRSLVVRFTRPLRIPVETCKPEDNSCMNAPGGPLGSRRQLHEQGGHDCRGATRQSRIQAGPSFK